MFTRSDLFSLMDAAPELGASIFLPTHVRGAEIRQDPIRLKNLAVEARDKEASREASWACSPSSPPVSWPTTYCPESDVGKVPEPSKR